MKISSPFFLSLTLDPNPSVKWSDPYRTMPLVTAEMPWKASFPARMSDVGREVERNFLLFLEINDNCSKSLQTSGYYII